MSDATNQSFIPEGAPAQAPEAPDSAKPTTAPAAGAEVKLDAEPVAAPAPDSDTSTEFTYDPTGDASLDYALSFVGRLGYGDTHPAIQAAQAGDFALLKAELATKGVPGAEQVLALAEQAYGRFTAERAKADAALEQFAVQAAGSAENWATVRAWAAAEATPQEKAQVNAALAQGGIVAQGVLAQLVSMYNQKFTLPKEAAAVAKPGAAATPGSVAEPMTAKAYAKAVEALRQKYGNRTDSTPEYASLQSQRLAAKRAGY